jgi:hypothetical protein
MAQFGKHFTASILGALVLGVTTPGAWAEQGAGSISGAGMTSNPAGQLEREISVKGKIVCVECNLEDMRKQHPQAQSLYQLTHQHGRIVMQIDEVDDLRQWQRDTFEGAWRRVARARAQVPRSAARRVPVSGWAA